MDPIIGGALIGGGSSLLGGLFGRDSNEDVASRNAKMQKEFAQHGIRWKVADAKAAGIHPLYGLGASTASFSPMAVGDPLGPAIAAAGQDISRGIEATRTNEERKSAEADAFINGAAARLDAAKMRALDLQHRELQNALLAAQLAKLNAAPNPPMPSMGPTPAYVPGGPRHVAGPGLLVRGGSAPEFGAISIDPSKTTSRSPGSPHLTAGSDAAFDQFQFGPGQYMFGPTQKLSESLEGMGLIGHAVAPLIMAAEEGRRLTNKLHGGEPPKMSPGPGRVWTWSIMRQAWQSMPAANWSQTLGRGRSMR